MRILVTGAAGFLGSHLCDRLLALGHRVVGMDNFITGNRSNLDHLKSHPSFQLILHDVANFIEVEGPLEGVFHFASPASPVDYLELPIQTLKVGSLGTHKALGLAKAKGARFLLASTSEVYGDPLVHPQPESYWGNVNPVGPRGVYDEAKRFAEAITIASTGSTPGSCVSSIPMGPACDPAMAAWCRTLSCRRSRASRSPCTVTAPRPARFAMWTTSLRAS